MRGDVLTWPSHTTISNTIAVTYATTIEPTTYSKPQSEKPPLSQENPSAAIEISNGRITAMLDHSLVATVPGVSGRQTTSWAITDGHLIGLHLAPVHQNNRATAGEITAKPVHSVTIESNNEETTEKVVVTSKQTATAKPVQSTTVLESSRETTEKVVLTLKPTTTGKPVQSTTLESNNKETTEKVAVTLKPSTTVTVTPVESTFLESNNRETTEKVVLTLKPTTTGKPVQSTTLESSNKETTEKVAVTLKPSTTATVTPVESTFLESNNRETTEKFVLTSKPSVSSKPRQSTVLESNNIETKQKVVLTSKLAAAAKTVQSTALEFNIRETTEQMVLTSMLTQSVQGVQATAPQPINKETTEQVVVTSNHIHALEGTATQLDNIKTSGTPSKPARCPEAIPSQPNNKETTWTLQPAHGLEAIIPEPNNRNIMQSSGLTVKPARSLTVPTKKLIGRDYKYDYRQLVKYRSGISKGDVLRPIIRKSKWNKHRRLPDCQNRPKCYKRVCFCLNRNKSPSIYRLHHNCTYLSCALCAVLLFTQ